VTDNNPRSPRPEDGYWFDITRPPAAAPDNGQLAWESTVTAPTEWVPHVPTDAELQRLASRRALSVSSLVAGATSLLVALFTIWAVPLSLAAVVLALRARQVEGRARVFWLSGLVTGIAGLVMAGIWLVYILGVAPGPMP
jgi:hypothetical protein